MVMCEKLPPLNPADDADIAMVSRGTDDGIVGAWQTAASEASAGAWYT